MGALPLWRIRWISGPLVGLPASIRVLDRPRLAPCLIGLALWTIASKMTSKGSAGVAG